MALSAVVFSPVGCILNSGTRRELRCCSSTTRIDDLMTNYWTPLVKEIDQKLVDLVPVMYPERLHEAMRYSLLTKGAKRLLPLMCIATSELFGLSRFATFPTACALEMAHVSTLIHDDLPCIDDSPSRRGKPCSHTVFGADMALLAGGALTLVGLRHIVSETPTHLVPATRILQVIAEVSRAAGSTRMAGARFLELGATPDAGDFVGEMKLGEVFQTAAVCGGLLAGASHDEIKRLRNYGRAVGVLCQLVHDITTDETNKSSNNKSYLSVYGVEEALEVAQDLKSEAKKELDGFQKYGHHKVLLLHDFVDYATDNLELAAYNVDLRKN